MYFLPQLHAWQHGTQRIKIARFWNNHPGEAGASAGPQDFTVEPLAGAIAGGMNRRAIFSIPQANSGRRPEVHCLP